MNELPDMHELLETTDTVVLDRPPGDGADRETELPTRDEPRRRPAEDPTG